MIDKLMCACDIYLKNLQMQDSLLKKYSEKFPNLKDVLESFKGPYTKKLWNELTILILQFLYNKETKNRVDFDFYDKFVKEFQWSLDSIKLLKIVRMCIHNLNKDQQLKFLEEFEKNGRLSEQAKLIVKAMEGLALVEVDISKCLPIIESLKKQIEGKKDIEQYLYSTYYKLDFTYYRKKGKYRQFYTNALQYLAYTNVDELNQKEQIELSYEMGVAVLLSKDIYNFSEMLEQPLLQSLKDTPYAWVYTLLNIFNRGDIKEYAAFKASAEASDKVFQENVKAIDQKIQVASFLELVFNQPKNDRVLPFQRIAAAAGVPEDRVEWIVMRAMGLGLVKGGIDQLKKTVTTTWSKPKVLELARIKVMEGKFQQWNSGLRRLSEMLQKKKVPGEI